MADDDVTIPETDASISLEDGETNEDGELYPLVATIQERFERSRSERYQDEERWVRAYYAFRGLYGKDVEFTDTEKSRIFVKITKTKVMAAYGQLMDVLFGNEQMPLSVEPTTLPEGVVEAAHVDLEDPTEQGGQTEAPTAPLGFPGDGNDLQPGETLTQRLGNFVEKLKGAKVKEGQPDTMASVTVEPAKVAAKKMQKKIVDQLEESNAGTHFRHACFEMVLTGTGIIKGAFAYDKEYPKWTPEGDYEPVIKTMPKLEAVSVWNFYPDPEAIDMSGCDWVIERHKMTKTELRELKKRPHFRDGAIEEVIDGMPNYQRQWWEDAIDDSIEQNYIDRYEVLEYWGNIDASDLEEMDITIPSEMKDFMEFSINCWISNHRIIRLIINPFKPKRIPYHACPYELNPYNFFGVGLPENMEDCQQLMNGFTRLAVDNAVLAGNIMVEVDETNLTPGQDLKVWPGKVWRRNSGPPGQAIFATKWPSTANENMMMYDKFRQLSDEATGLPSFSHGQTGVQGTGRTASGISMLMGAASLSVKTVVKNVDDFFLQPIGEAFFQFNMQFDNDPEIQGDLEVKARGISSLMQKEVRSQRLMTFMQVGANPMIAPWINFPAIIREIADTLNLDPDKVTNNPEMAQLQKMLMQQDMQAMQADPGQAGPPAAPGANVQDPTGAGGGNIGTGQAPGPDEGSFSGNIPGSGSIQ